MVAAGALCLGGAVIGRRWIGILASTVMLLAMIDLTVSRIVAPVLWAGALVAAAVLLGLGLRRDGAVRPDSTPVHAAAVPGVAALGTGAAAVPGAAVQGVAVPGVAVPGVAAQGTAGTVPAPRSALIRHPRLPSARKSAPIRRHAWLPRSVMVAAALAYPATAWLVLGHGDGAGSHPGAAAVPGHHGAATLTAALPLAAVVMLVAALLGLGLLAIRDRRALPAAEAGGMAAMLLAMLAGHG